jgi:hypothetical protein
LSDVFCFDHEPVHLINLARIPDVCQLENRSVVMGETLLIIVMYILSYPKQQQEVARIFGLSGQPFVSRILSYGVDHFIENFSHLLQSEDDDALLMWRGSIDDIVESVQLKNYAGERFERVGMFIDGSFNHCCK